MSSSQILPSPEGPEYTLCGCSHIEPEHEPDAGACLSCDCEAYRPAGQAPATEERAARWETAALKAGREVDRNALRVYMAVADAEQAELRRMAVEAQQPETQPEDPARIDRLRPEFFEHASVESIDSQIRRAETQQRQWGNRVQTLAILRQARVMQKELGEWPAVEAQQSSLAVEDCTCIPFTRQGGVQRYCQPGDTVDMISGWEIGGDCPHHRDAAKAQQPARHIPCPDAFWLRRPEAPHDWQQRPDAQPVHCPGVPDAQQPKEARS